MRSKLKTSKKKPLKPLDSFDNVNYHNNDIIASSGRIKRIFLERCKELNISPYLAAKRCGVRYQVAKVHWIQSQKPKISKAFTQRDVINMLNYVGIEIKIMTIVKPLEESTVYIKRYESQD